MRLAYIDFLRFIAAFAVLIQHSTERVETQLFAGILSLAPGIFGVVLFFFISGYVIPYSIRNNFSIIDFIIRRVFRIFPAYLLVLAVVVVLGAFGVMPWSQTLERGGAAGLLANVFLVQDYIGMPTFVGVSWTLFIEFVWYFIFLVLVALFGLRRILYIALAGSAFVLLCAFASALVDIRLPLGRIGMVNAALLGYSAYAVHQKLISMRQFVCLSLAFLVAILGAIGVSFGYFSHPKVTLFNVMSGWVIAFGVFFAFIVSGSIRSNHIVNNAVPSRLGQISYSVYLIHGLIISVVEALVGAWWMLLVAPCFILLISTWTFETVEKGGIVLGKRLSARIRPNVNSKTEYAQGIGSRE